MKKYLKMKDSQMNWVENIPEKWDVKRLKFTTKFELSTVDRHEYDDEIRVSICHYPQVYNNEKITTDTELSRGTCNQKEFEKFRLKKDDVLITKDSETQNDIGVPVYIEENFDKAVCGYHVAQLTTDKNQILGSFLFRFIQLDIVNAYFETEANGVTRFGLGKDSINNLKTILPTILEQKLISKFLDKNISIIIEQISKNQKLLKLLKQKIQSTINKAVTKGIDPLAPIIDSNIERIGKIPQHWDINKIKFTSSVKGRIGWQGLRSEEFTDEGAFLITGTDFDEGKINWSTCHHVELWRYEQNPFIQIKNKDILITKDGTIGKIAFVDHVPDKTTLNSGVMVIRPIKEKYEPTYLFWLLKSNQFIDFIEMIKSGSTIQHLYQETFKNFKFTLPPTLDEQKNISEFLNKKINQIEDSMYIISCQIKKLQEYRESLLSSTITGKIDLREVVA